MSDQKVVIFAAFTIPVEPSDLEWIGTLSVLWSQVEYCVEAALYNVQGLTFTEGRKTTLPRDISARAKRLSALVFDVCQPDDRDAFTSLCERVIEVAPLRNLAIHGHWCRLRDHDNAPAAVSWFKVPIEERITQLLPAELPKIAVEVGAISRSLYELLERRGAFTYAEE